MNTNFGDLLYGPFRDFRSRLEKMKRSIAKRLAGVAGLMAALCGCAPDRTADLDRLREICKSFTFISADQSKVADGLRERIQTGEIDPWRDLTFRSGPQNSGKYSKPEGDLRNFEGLFIQHIDVFENGLFKIHMRFPEYRAENGLITMLAPSYVPISCSDLENRPLHSYI